MLDLGMQLVKGDWSDAMRAARLTALLKGVPDDSLTPDDVCPICLVNFQQSGRPFIRWNGTHKYTSTSSYNHMALQWI